MSEFQLLADSLTNALALAHAALDKPTVKNAERARSHAAQVWPRIKRLSRAQLTLGEAQQIAVLLRELRQVLAAVEREQAFSQAG
jgi:hypothetical protein